MDLRNSKRNRLGNGGLYAIYMTLQGELSRVSDQLYENSNIARDVLAA